MDKKKPRKVNNISFVFTFLIAEVVNKLAKLRDALLIRKISFFGDFELGQKLFLLDFLASGVLYEVVSKARKIWDSNYAQIFWTGKLLFTSSIFLFAQTMVRVSDSRLSRAPLLKTQPWAVFESSAKLIMIRQQKLLTNKKRINDLSIRRWFMNIWSKTNSVVTSYSFFHKRVSSTHHRATIVCSLFSLLFFFEVFSSASNVIESRAKRVNLLLEPFLVRLNQLQFFWVIQIDLN